jgi:hypothetical protein
LLLAIMSQLYTGYSQAQSNRLMGLLTQSPKQYSSSLTARARNFFIMRY